MLLLTDTLWSRVSLSNASTPIGRPLCWNTKVLLRALAFALVCFMVTHEAVAADQRSGHVEANRTITFDLPAQSLVSALELYSIASGWQVIYDANLATGRRSAAVRGDFAPGVALQMLLAGTGLMPQHMATDGVLLVPEPAATSGSQQTLTASRFAGYYGRIQTSLKRAFCATPQIRSGAYRIALGLWIGSSGAVARSELLGSTGNVEIDQTFDRTIRALSVGEAPPAGFAQPVVVLVTPDLTAQCGAADAELQPIRAAR